MLPNHLQGQLDIIGSDSAANATKCTTKMFEYWLQVDTTASWNKLIEALRKINKFYLADTICREVLQDISAYSYKHGYIVVFYVCV